LFRSQAQEEEQQEEAREGPVAREQRERRGIAEKEERQEIVCNGRTSEVGEVTASFTW